MSLNDRVTDHFRLKEFLWSQHCHRHAALSRNPAVLAAQQRSIRFLAEQLEVIRAWFQVPGGERPVKVLSGVRDEPIHRQLLADGIRSSSITDHAYFSPEVWAWGVGAVDFRMEAVPHHEIFHTIFNRQDSLAFSYVKQYPWGIHMSAPADLVLNVRPSRPRFQHQVDGAWVDFTGTS